MNRAVFFDRDGTLGGQGGYCHPDEFRLFDFAAAAVKLVRDAGFLAVVITNQSRIGKGQITLEQVETSFWRLQTELEAQGTRFDAWYICPHVIHCEPIHRHVPLPERLIPPLTSLSQRQNKTLRNNPRANRHSDFWRKCQHRRDAFPIPSASPFSVIIP